MLWAHQLWTLATGAIRPSDQVFVKDKSTGNIKTVRFGDPNMKIKRNSTSNRESFMARHGATLKKVKGQKNLSPVYWALRSWKLGTKIS